jgi:hypothetical protein
LRRQKAILNIGFQAIEEKLSQSFVGAVIGSEVEICDGGIQGTDGEVEGTGGEIEGRCGVERLKSDESKILSKIGRRPWQATPTF